MASAAIMAMVVSEPWPISAAAVRTNTVPPSSCTLMITVQWKVSER